MQRPPGNCTNLQRPLDIRSWLVQMKGKRLEWVVNYRDDKNYDLFQMEDKYLVRTRFANGKKGDSARIPHSIKAKDYVSVMIAVTPGSVVHSFLVEQQ